MIEWLNNYSELIQIVVVIFNLFIALITAFLFLGILGVTWWYAMSTNKLAVKTAESIEITKEKEKTDRTLELLSEFNRDKFFSLQDMVNISSEFTYVNLTDEMVENLKKMSDDPRIRGEISYFIGYFDTVAFFYFEKKLNKKLFEVKFIDDFTSFIINYKEIIKRIFRKDKKDIEKILYWRRNFFKLAVEVLDKKRNIESKYKKNFEELYNFYNELLIKEKK